EGRTADHFQHVGGGSLLLQRLAQLAEQSRVLNGDDGLGGESRHEFYLLLGKWVHLISREREDTDRAPLTQERYAEVGSVPVNLLILLVAVIGIGQHVGNMDCPAFQ